MTNEVIATDEKDKNRKPFMAAVLGLEEIHLEIGDIVIGKFIIERKEINDLIRSALKGNLFRQLSRIKEFCEKNPEYVGILLIEGWKMNKHTYNAVQRGMITKPQIIASAMESFNIFCVQTKSLNESIEFVKVLSTINLKSHITEVRGYKRKVSDKSQITFVLQGLPTIGPARAKEIMEAYGSLEEYFWDKSENGHDKISELLNKRFDEL